MVDTKKVTQAAQAPLPALAGQIGLLLEQDLEHQITRACERGEPAPRIFNRYEIQKIVARGAFGIVLDAQDLQLARRVALKLVPIVRDGQASAGVQRRELDRLAREGRALAKIDHPGVVRVFDSGAAEVTVGKSSLSCSFVAMELLHGHTLVHGSTRWPRGFAVTLPLLVHAGYGLMAVHEAGLVHRDIKPENVIVTKGRAVLVDFGLARLLLDPGERRAPPGSDPILAGVTTIGSAVGTLEYMAPEVRLGQPCSFASDQWSFAAMSWELLSGKPPQVVGSRVRFRRWWRIPRGLRSPLRRALAAQPDARYAKVGDLVEDLAAWGQARFEAARSTKWVTRLAIVAVVVTTPLWGEFGKAIIDAVSRFITAVVDLVT